MIDKERIIQLNKDGKTCQEIRDELGYSLTTIRKYIKENGLKTNSKKIVVDNNILDKILKYINEGKTNLEIASILNMSPTTVRKYTKSLGRDTNSKKSKGLKNDNFKLSEEQLEVLYGSLLGNMYIGTSSKMCRVSICHGESQEEYFDYKCSIFHNLLGKVNKTPRYDKRTQKYYNRYTVRLLSNPIFNVLHDELYKNGIKTITESWLNKLTERSLAFWFMDDGSNSGVLATNCFSKDECILIQQFLKKRFNIDTTLETSNKQYLVYIKKCSRKHFYEITNKYFIPSMMYKIQNWNL